MGAVSAAGVCVLLLLSVLSPARPARAVPSSDSFVVIIASSSKITDIPAAVLRSAFQGLRVAYQGVNLIPFNAPHGTPARQRVDWVMLGLEPSEVGTFWVNQRIRDGRNPPRTLPSLDLAVRVVAQLQGAISCVPETLVTPQVRALHIDGKAPSDNGYLLSRH